MLREFLFYGRLKIDEVADTCFRYLIWVAIDNESEVNDGRKQIIQDLLIPNSRRCCTS